MEALSIERQIWDLTAQKERIKSKRPNRSLSDNVASLFDEKLRSTFQNVKLALQLRNTHETQIPIPSRQLMF